MSALASSAASNPPSKAPAAAVQPLAPAPNGVASTASILPSDKPIDAPEHCPGTESVDAGKASSCEGCANQDACLSAPKGPDPDLPEVARRMASIKHKILVLSGKGGVGKSTFTTALAWALASDETVQTGIMDVDICGPSLPTMLGLADQRLHATSSGWTPLYVLDNLCAMSIGFMLPSASDAVIWRGAKKNGLIKQFLRDVDWGPLDYLVVDTPPGTSDEHLSVVKYLAASGQIDGAVVLTTPQEVALQDVAKELDFCRKVGLRVLGLVENMSGFVCPACHGESDIFIPSTGGADRLAKQFGIPLLGKVPLDPRIGKACDSGVSFLDAVPDSPATHALLDIVDHLRDMLEGPVDAPVENTA